MLSLREWSYQQMEAAGIEDHIQDAVIILIETWQDRELADRPDSEEILTVFTTLARGHSLVDTSDDAFDWVPATSPRGRPRQHSVVRVRRDAFDGEKGRALNGKVGRLARVSRGVLVVSMDDGFVHLAPEDLETQVEKL